MYKEHRAQLSIEVVLIVAVVFLISLLVFGNYFSISDSTIALITLKAEILKELNKQDDLYTIGKIEFLDCGNNAKFNVITEPESPDPSINTSQIEDEIEQKTKWDSIQLTFNATDFSC